MPRMHHPARSRIEDTHESHPYHGAAEDIADGVHPIENDDNGAVCAVAGD